MGSTSRIGIWERRPGDDRYERLSGLSPFWADLVGFSRTSQRRRVILLGESVARGLFYDPVITPAGMLEQCLEVHAPGEFEVLDLAKNGARAHEILDLAESARELEPSAVVVFAGNNWKYDVPDQPSAESRCDEARALKEDGLAGLLRCRTARLAEGARSLVQAVCQTFGGLAPVLFVVPESNLLDWLPASLSPALGGGRDGPWQRGMRHLRDAAAAGDWNEVLHRCEGLHKLDGGVGDEVHRLEGQAHLQLGNPGEALASFRQARDVRLWCDGIDPSWLPSAGAAATAQTAAECGATVVDLTEVLPRNSASGIPDRSVFADFCHLNWRGLTVSVAEIAAALGETFGLPTTADTCRAALTPPSQEVAAGAAMCAAVVSADFAQPEDTLRHFAAEAVAASRRILPAMEAYCSAPPAPVPWSMRSPGLPAPANVKRFVEGISRTGRYWRDEALVSSFSAEIQKARADKIDSRAHRALKPRRPTELLDTAFAPAWRPADWEGLIGGLAGPAGYRHYFRAHAETSGFLFCVQEPADIAFELTARLGSSGTGAVEVWLNSERIGGVALRERWRRLSLGAPSRLVRSGRNDLEIRWDRPEIYPAPVCVRADRLAQGLVQELSLVFGELHSLRATLAAPVEKSILLTATSESPYPTLDERLRTTFAQERLTPR